LGVPINSVEMMNKAAQDLVEKGASAVLIKGGHLDEKHQELIDVLAFRGDSRVENCQFKHSRIKTSNTHGTGCTLSSAIASYLALNYSLKDSIGLAINYLQDALLASRSLHLGKGSGPLWHMFNNLPRRD
jgi:hydroxymethylpyrimidine/phosphomethylpyrimidine kinase